MCIHLLSTINGGYEVPFRVTFTWRRAGGPAAALIHIHLAPCR
jgi:hypothetical protein